MFLGGCLMNKIFVEGDRIMVDFVTFVRKTSMICLPKGIWAKLHFPSERPHTTFSEDFGLNYTEKALKEFMYH